MRCIAESGDGRLLVGGESGVWFRSDGRWRLAVTERAGEGHGVYALLVGTDGRTWVGARDGLWVLEEDHLRRAPVSLPADRAVYSLVQDRQGRLWIGTDFGAYRTDGERLQHFTVRNGLSGNDRLGRREVGQQHCCRPCGWAVAR